MTDLPRNKQADEIDSIDDGEDDRERGTGADNDPFGVEFEEGQITKKSSSQSDHLAMVSFNDDDGSGNGPSPFRQQNAPAQVKPADAARSSDAAPVPAVPPEKNLPEGNPAERNPADRNPGEGRVPVREVSEANVFAAIPRQSIDAVQRAIQALGTVEPGKPLTQEQRRALESAITDAGSIKPEFAKEQTDKLTADLASKDRKLPNGMVLPPWTPEKEAQMWQKLADTAKALEAVPEPTRSRMGAIEQRIKSLAPQDLLTRAQLEQQMQTEANEDKTGKAAMYMIQAGALDRFMKENATGIMRRNIHEQEISTLNGKALVQGIYALAMDRAGQPEDRKKIEESVKETLANPQAVNKLPEVLQLKEKYNIKENDPLDDKVPGRQALKQALEIMNDQRQGTMAQRLEKARPLFEQSTGAADRIDTKAVEKEIEAIAKEAAELGPAGDPKRLAELDERAVLLLEQRKLPGVARMAYAMALNHTAAENGDKKLNDDAVAVLKTIEKQDPGAKFDPLVQGAIKLAAEGKKLSEEEALKAGGPEVERLKDEARKAGKDPEADKPMWRKILEVAGPLVASVVAFEAIRWGFNRTIGAGISNTRRAVELWRRSGGVEVAPELKAGEQPKLYFKDAQGRELPVEGVRKEDGKVRLRNGEIIEVAPAKGKFILKVSPDSGVTAEQAKEIARKALTPTSTEVEMGNARAALAKQNEELERLRQEHDALKKLFEGSERSGQQASPEARIEARPMADGAARGLETARSLKGEQPGLKLTSRAHVEQFLKSTLDAIDELPSDKKWTESDRSAFAKLLEDYKRGEAAAVEAVHRQLSVDIPQGERPAQGQETRTGSHEALDRDLSTLRDLERMAADPGKRVKMVADLIERGPIRETLEKAGIEKSRAATLERELLSEKQEIRERAQAEIGKAYEGRGGIRGFAKEARGRMGALVLVAAAALPFVFGARAVADDGPEATWRGGR